MIPATVLYTLIGFLVTSCIALVVYLYQYSKRMGEQADSALQLSIDNLANQISINNEKHDKYIRDLYSKWSETNETVVTLLEKITQIVEKETPELKDRIGRIDSMAVKNATDVTVLKTRVTSLENGKTLAGDKYHEKINQ